MATSPDTLVPEPPGLVADEPPGGFLDCRGQWHPWTSEEDD